MASPISIGDAIELSRIAYKVGQAFTSGRKSAPAEFAEIQNLLYTLSNALNLVAKDAPRSVCAIATELGDSENAVLLQIIANCRSTLEHLESLVANYTELDLKTEQANQGGPRGWKDNIKRNWKKVIWTKEGGGIDKLKTTLTAHVDGLNLAVSAFNK